MQKNTRFLLCGALALLGIGLYILGATILPDTIGVQIQLDGTLANRVSKYVGMLIPLGLTVGGAVIFFVKNSGKALFYSFLGLFLYAITFWMNLR